MSRVYHRVHVTFVLKGIRCRYTKRNEMSRVYHRVHVTFVLKGMRCRECIIGHT